MLWFLIFAIVSQLALLIYVICSTGGKNPVVDDPGWSNISEGSYYRDKQRRRAEHAAHFATFDPPLNLNLGSCD